MRSLTLHWVWLFKFIFLHTLNYHNHGLIIFSHHQWWMMNRPYAWCNTDCFNDFVNNAQMILFSIEPFLALIIMVSILSTMLLMLFWNSVTIIFFTILFLSKQVPMLSYKRLLRCPGQFECTIWCIYLVDIYFIPDPRDLLVCRLLEFRRSSNVDAELTCCMYYVHHHHYLNQWRSPQELMVMKGCFHHQN